MEQNNKYQVFEIICDDKELISKVIYLYNNTYNTNFELIDYILDEVNFAKIGGNVQASDIFSLGSIYGRMSK
ncbi:hypothetical protein AGMMS50239_41010 [Bacteroidia bacterium]|nr:hypothetical protein AGMMS50239_41010 [Bacteroidia bacterium]